MRKAVYLILLALLLLELVTVEGKCLGAKCSAMTLCADRCNKCTSTLSCKSAQRYCDRAKEAVKCAPPVSSGKCKYDCSKCTSTVQCRSVVAKCKQYGITSCPPRSTSSTFPPSVCGQACKPRCSSLDKKCLYCQKRRYCTAVSKCKSDCSKCSSSIKRRYGITSCKPTKPSSAVSRGACASKYCKATCRDKTCILRQRKCGVMRYCPTQQSQCASTCRRRCKPTDKLCLAKLKKCASKGLCSTCNGKCKSCQRLPAASFSKCADSAIPYCGRSCLPPPTSTAPKGMADTIDMDWDEPDQIPGADPIESTSGLIAFKVTKPALISVAVVIFLLVINISCLCYNKCIKNRKDKKIMYAKVAAVASSDDDMENLKRVEI